MLILAKAMLAMMIGFVMAVISGLIIVPLLKKFNIKQTINVFLEKTHLKKEGTPVMGGIIFIIPTLITVFILLATDKMQLSTNLIIVLFVFLAYALLGFIDDYLIVKRHSNEGLTEFQKLFGQVLIALIFFFLYLKAGNEPHIVITTIGLDINLGWAYGILILFLLVASSNAVNITDGLDGLAGGLSAIAFLAIAMTTWNSPATQGSQDIAIFCFVLTGALVGFLVFNAHPAKVFMGDTGSLSLGATLASVAVLTSHEITFIVIAGVFIIETLASLLQMIWIMCFHKKLLLMAPLHHHFEKLGYSETTIVRGFLTVGLILAMAAILFSVWI